MLRDFPVGASMTHVIEVGDGGLMPPRPRGACYLRRNIQTTERGGRDPAVPSRDCCARPCCKNGYVIPDKKGDAAMHNVKYPLV